MSTLSCRHSHYFRRLLVVSISLLTSLLLLSTSSTADTAVGSSLHVLPAPGTRLYTVPWTKALNKSVLTTLSLAIQTNTSNGNVSVLVSNRQLLYYSLPYPSFHLATVNCSERTCVDIELLDHVAVHPISQHVYFTAWSPRDKSSKVGHFFPNGTLHMFAPLNNVTHKPLLFDCWALAFSTDGANMYVGNYLISGQFSIVQINVTDNSIVRQLLTNEKGGAPLALTPDDLNNVYVMRAGTTTNYRSNASISIYSPTSADKINEVAFKLTMINEAGDEVAAGLAWHDGVLYVAGGKYVQAIDCASLREQGKVNNVLLFHESMKMAIYVAVMPDSSVVVGDVDVGLMFYQGLQNGSSSRSSSSSSGPPSFFASSSSSSHLPLSPPPGTVLYQLNSTAAMGRWNAPLINSIAIQTNHSNGNVTVFLSNLDTIVYSLPYGAFHPVHAHSGCSPRACGGQIDYVAVHPISQQVYFTARAADDLTGRVNVFLQNGSWPAFAPLNNVTNEPLLVSCWALAFSVDGAYLYYGNRLESGQFTVVQINTIDGTIARQLLTDEEGGAAYALTSDNQHNVYVLRAGVGAGRRNNGTVSIYSPTSVEKTIEMAFTLSLLYGQRDAVTAGLAWHDDVLYVANGWMVQAIDCVLLREQGVLRTLFMFSKGTRSAIHVAVMPDSTVVVGDIDTGLLFLQGLGVTAHTSSSSSTSSSSFSSSSSSLFSSPSSSSAAFSSSASSASSSSEVSSSPSSSSSSSFSSSLSSSLSSSSSSSSSSPLSSPSSPPSSSSLFSSSSSALSSSSSSATSSSSSVSPPGTLLYRLKSEVAMNKSGANDVGSIAIQTNSSNGAITVILANLDPAVYSLPYSAFQPVDVHYTGCSLEVCNWIVYVAVHPISQQIFFTPYSATILTGQIGHFLPDGSVSFSVPTNASTGAPLLSQCWSFTFSADGSYLYFGNYVRGDYYSIVQFDSSDGSIVRQLLTDELGGEALALTSDDKHNVYVVRAGLVVGHKADGSISVYTATKLAKDQVVPFTLSPFDVQEELIAVGLAWHDNLLYVADGHVVQAVDGVLLRERGALKVVFFFDAYMSRVIRVAVMPDSTVVAGDLDLGLLFLQGLGEATSSSTSSPSSLSSTASLSSSSPPASPSGTLLCRLSLDVAMNKSGANDISSMAIASNNITHSVTVILANLDPAYYSLPYPAFQPVTVHDTGCTADQCNSVVYVAVHPISQVVYFTTSSTLTGQIGYFLPNGSVSILSPINDTTHMPLLFECWSFAFSPDGAYLYYGNYLMNGGFTIVQFNSTDGSIVRQLLTDEKGGDALALITDDQHNVYVLRAGAVVGHKADGSISVYTATSGEKQREVPITLTSINEDDEAMLGGLAWHDDVLYVADGRVVRAVDGALLRAHGQLRTVFSFSASLNRTTRVAVMPDSTVVAFDMDTGLLFLQGLGVIVSASSISSSSSSLSSSPFSNSSSSSSSLSSSFSSAPSSNLASSSSSFSSPSSSSLSSSPSSSSSMASASSTSLSIPSSSSSASPSASSSPSPSASSLSSSSSSSRSVSSTSAQSSSSSSSTSSHCPVPSCPDDDRTAVAWSSSVEYALTVVASLLIGVAAGLCIALFIIPKWRMGTRRSRWSNAAARSEAKRQRALAQSLLRQEERIGSSSVVLVHD